MARLIQQDTANAQIMLAWRIEEIRVRTHNQKRLPDPRTLLVADAPVHADALTAARQQRQAWLDWAELQGVTIRTDKKVMH